MPATGADPKNLPPEASIPKNAELVLVQEVLSAALPKARYRDDMAKLLREHVQHLSCPRSPGSAR